MCARVMQSYCRSTSGWVIFQGHKSRLTYIIVDAQETMRTFVWDYVLNTSACVCICVPKRVICAGILKISFSDLLWSRSAITVILYTTIEFNGKQNKKIYYIE